MIFSNKRRHSIFLRKKDKPKIILDELIFRDTVFPINIFIESRQNATVSIRKKINIRIPKYLTKHEQDKNIERLKEWALRKIQENPHLSQLRSERHYYNGMEISILGITYTLKLNIYSGKQKKGKFHKSLIILSIPETVNEKDFQKVVQECFIKTIKNHCQKATETLIHDINNNFLSKNIKKISIRNTKSQWGSCSRTGNISIATRLFLTTPEIFRYVCVHEVAHLKEGNHSRKFWKLVEKMDPNYKKHRKWLRKNGSKCHF